MNYFVVTILVIVGIAGTLVALFYGLNSLVHHQLKSRYTTIAENFHVEDEWKEFETEKPKRSKNERRNIFLKVSGYEFDRDDDECAIKLRDGTVLVPQIQVQDSSGRKYEARDTSRWGNLIGFAIERSEPSDPPLSDEQEHVTVRIRSDVPFACEKIGWSNKRPK